MRQRETVDHNWGRGNMTVLLCAPASGNGVERIASLLLENRIAFTVAHINGLVEPRIEFGREKLIGYEAVRKHLQALIDATAVR